MIDKKQLFTNAWTIAKIGAKNFGGSSKEYFGEALRMAYQGGFKFGLHVDRRSWVARILGTNKKYKFNRSFVLNTQYDHINYIELGDGLYDVKDNNQRYFLLVDNGSAREVYDDEATEIAQKMGQR